MAFCKVQSDKRALENNLKKDSSTCTHMEIILKNQRVHLTIGDGIIFQESFAITLREISKNIVIVTDKNLNRIYGKKLKSFLEKHRLNVKIIEIAPGENNKTRSTKEYIEDEMMKKNIGRDTLILSFGGGVVSDIATFTASTYLRGIPLILVPTSLLSMVDAAIGGKSGVNSPYGKNMIGSFYQPKHIFIDPLFLSSLPKKEYLNGLAEIIKYSLIADEELFNKLSKKNDPTKLDIRKIIYRCCLLKKEIVEKDEKESGLRSILNFGHTVGHCIEFLENFQISHGEAIAIGMIFSSYLSVKKKYLEMRDFLKIFSLFKKYGFSLIFSKNLSWQKISQALSSDKKAEDKTPRFILIEKIGKVAKVEALQKDALHKVDGDELKSSLIWLYKRFVSKKEDQPCSQ